MRIFFTFISHIHHIPPHSFSTFITFHHIPSHSSHSKWFSLHPKFILPQVFPHFFPLVTLNDHFTIFH